MRSAAPNLLQIIAVARLRFDAARPRPALADAVGRRLRLGHLAGHTLAGAEQPVNATQSGLHVRRRQRRPAAARPRRPRQGLPSGVRARSVPL